MKNVVILGTAHPHIYALAASIKKRTDAKLAYVYDSNPQLCKESAEKIGAPAAASVEEALACKPSLMITAAVPNERARLIEQCMAAGVPVLVDKPLAVTEAALNQIISAQKKYKQPVMVYYPYRGSLLTLAAKRALDAGRIGKLVRVFSAGPHKLNPASRPSWHFSRSENGGALIDIGSHHFDACLWFSGGSKPHAVTALHGNFDQPTKTEFQDFAQAQVQFSSGVLAHVEVDWLNPVSMKNFGDTRMWLQGTTGKIELRLGDAPQTGEIWTSQTAKEPLDTAGLPTVEQWEDDLITALLNGTTLPIPQEDIWETSRMSLAAFESASMGGIPVKL